MNLLVQVECDGRDAFLIYMHFIWYMYEPLLLVKNNFQFHTHDMLVVAKINMKMSTRLPVKSFKVSFTKQMIHILYLLLLMMILLMTTAGGYRLIWLPFWPIYLILLPWEQVWRALFGLCFVLVVSIATFGLWRTFSCMLRLMHF